MHARVFECLYIYAFIYTTVLPIRRGMVCQDCEKKLGSVACPEPWKHGSRAAVGSSSRKLGENKALSSKKAKFQPYAKFEKCRICKQPIHQVGSHYCQGCAYKKGICAMCGKKIIDVKHYKQSST